MAWGAGLGGDAATGESLGARGALWIWAQGDLVVFELGLGSASSASISLSGAACAGRAPSITSTVCAAPRGTQGTMFTPLLSSSGAGLMALPLKGLEEVSGEASHPASPWGSCNHVWGL